MTERDKRISDQLVRLVQIIFGVVLAQSLVLYRDVIVHPFSATAWVATLGLVTVYLTTVLSWIDWHVTMELRPYNFSQHNVYRWYEEFRLFFDLFIVTVYAYMLFAVDTFKTNPGQWIGEYLIGFAVVFAAYFLSGYVRRITHGSLASNPAPIVWTGVVYIGLYIIYSLLYAKIQPHALVNAIAILLAAFIMVAYRLIRRRVVKQRNRVKKAGLVVAVDIDGVLADQITGILPKVRHRHGVDLSYGDVTEWRLPIGSSDIAQEILQAFDDPDYIINMPVHPGARNLVDALYPHNTVVLLTARPETSKAATLQWLANHGFSVDGIVNAKEEKKSVHRSDVLIDDYINNVKEYLTETSGTAILVRQPWNKDAKDELADWMSSDRLHIVTSLAEARDIVVRLQKSLHSKQAHQPGSTVAPSPEQSREQPVP